MELLGVIVILAILSLIAVPVVLNLIDDTKEKAIERSIDNYISAVELAIANHNAKISNTEVSDGICIVGNDGNITCDGITIEVTVKNSKPTSGTLIIKDYAVVNYIGLTMNDKTVNNVEFNGTKVAATQSDTHKGIVYMDPTDLSRTCTAALSDANLNEYGTPTGVTSGCMKFYIYDDEGSNYKMILDHNAIPRATWVRSSQFLAAGGLAEEWSTNKVKYGPLNLPVEIKNNLGNWIGNPRVITANELAHIVGVDEALGWEQSKTFAATLPDVQDYDTQVYSYYLDGSGDTYTTWWVQLEYVPNSENKSRYAWLYDYTSDCIQYGCNYESNDTFPYSTYELHATDGYWLANHPVGNQLQAILVHNSGRIRVTNVGNSSMGIRPVIELPKTIIDGD